jgi:hypothetical protein
MPFAFAARGFFKKNRDVFKKNRDVLILNRDTVNYPGLDGHCKMETKD